jgi:uncharacterized protein (TIGR01732 family)
MGWFGGYGDGYENGYGYGGSFVLIVVVFILLCTFQLGLMFMAAPLDLVRVNHSIAPSCTLPISK